MNHLFDRYSIILTISLPSFSFSGPTWESQPAFAWTKQWEYVPHHGHPKLFAFDFETMQPNFK